MIFLVIVVLGSLLVVEHFDTGWVLLLGPSGPFAVFFSFLALILIMTRLAQLRASDALDESGGSIIRLQSLYSRCQRLLIALAAVAHFGLVFGTQWPQYCTDLVGRYAAGLDELLMLVPFLVLISVGYMKLYPVDRLIRQGLMGELLHYYEPVHPIWTQRQYVSFQLRFQVLLVAAPLMLIIAAKDLIEWQADALTRVGAMVLEPFELAHLAELTADGVLAVVAGLVILISPLMIRAIWHCRPLPHGTLRDELRAIAARVKLRYRDILLWPTHGIIVNAAVMGLTGRLRYIVLSDGLIETLTDGQIEAVFGHEIVHVKHHHLHFLLLFAFAAMGLLGLTAWYLQLNFQIPANYIQAGLLIAVFVVWFFFFGRLSRGFERQADLFAAESLSYRFDEVPTGCGNAECLRHHANPAPILSPDPPLCLSAAEVVCSALYRAAALNAVPRNLKTWRHGSIEHRCRTIATMANQPETFFLHKLRMSWIKIALVGAAALTAILALLTLASLKDYDLAIKFLRG